jgi:hypothetical protein
MTDIVQGMSALSGCSRTPCIQNVCPQEGHISSSNDMSDLYPQIAHSLTDIYASFKRMIPLINKSDNNSILKEFTKY